MTTIRDRNFSLMAPGLIPKADEYIGCNFYQRNQNIPLFPGDNTPRIFRRCNMINCIPPAGSKMYNCNTAAINWIEENHHQYLGKRDEDGNLDLLPEPRDEDVRTP